MDWTIREFTIYRKKRGVLSAKISHGGELKSEKNLRYIVKKMDWTVREFTIYRKYVNEIPEGW